MTPRILPLVLAGAPAPGAEPMVRRAADPAFEEWMPARRRR